LQAKLLRVLQERQVRRLGENRVREVDVRIVVAALTDLGGAVQRGEFREDLFYRLNVFPILLPPLRERKEDIPGLADYFLRYAAGRLNRPVTGFTAEAQRVLSWYDWPGNVRELENAVERLVAVVDHDPITRDDLERHFFGRKAAEADPLPTLEEVERQHIERVLHLRGWDMNRAAADLGIGRSTLFRKVKEYGLVRDT
jgi:DNA-binding NtrC family response regulator